MEGRKQMGSSSSFTSELFGSKESSSSNGIFGSIFAPSSKVVFAGCSNQSVFVWLLNSALIVVIIFLGLVYCFRAFVSEFYSLFLMLGGNGVPITMSLVISKFIFGTIFIG